MDMKTFTDEGYTIKESRAAYNIYDYKPESGQSAVDLLGGYDAVDVGKSAQFIEHTDGEFVSFRVMDDYGNDVSDDLNSVEEVEIYIESM